MKGTNFHVRKIEGKIEENEENRHLNDKKASKDHLLALNNFGVELSSILLFSHTLAHLEISWIIIGAFWHTLELDKEGKGKQ